MTFLQGVLSLAAEIDDQFGFSFPAYDSYSSPPFVSGIALATNYHFHGHFCSISSYLWTNVGIFNYHFYCLYFQVVLALISSILSVT
jgi:hypothetical protein